MRWMKLEPTIQSEVSRKGNTYWTLTHTYGILERQYQGSSMQGSKGDTYVKNRLLDSMGEGEGAMI